MENQEINSVDKEDVLLSLDALKMAGILWADGLPLKDWRISPLYGDFSDLAPITLFTGTADILNPDSFLLMNKMENHGISLDYREYRNMIHDWMLLDMPEADRCMEYIIELFNSL